MTIDPTAAAYAIGIAVAAISVAIAVIKSKKFDRIAKDVKEVLIFTGDKMSDGDFTAAEGVAVLMEIIKKL